MIWRKESKPSNSPIRTLLHVVENVLFCFFFWIFRIFTEFLCFQCYGFTIDVTAREQVTALSLCIRRQLSEVSMVVSNAGAMTCAPISYIRPETIVKLIEINLLAHFWVRNLILKKVSLKL